MDGACRTERAPGRYQPRRPSQSVLYRCVQEHLETWLHRFGSSLNAHLHFHCVVIDGVSYHLAKKAYKL